VANVMENSEIAHHHYQMVDVATIVTQDLLFQQESIKVDRCSYMSP